MRRWAEGPTKTKLFQRAEGIPMNKIEIFTSEKNGIIRMCLKVYTNSCKSKVDCLHFHFEYDLKF